MPVPEFDVNNHILDYVPRKKRKKYWISWLKGLLSQIDRLNKLFSYFRKGSIDLGYWSSVITYSSGDRARTLYGVFESIIDGNLNNNPITDDGDNWIKVLNDFIGATERASFTVQKLSFEKALNTRFQGALTDNGFVGFKQPETIDAGVGYLPLSDIFIDYEISTFTSFVSYPDAESSSASYHGTSTDFVFIVPSYSSATTYTASINIPLAVYNSLGANDAIRSSIVFNFVDTIKRVGTVYKIITY